MMWMTKMTFLFLILVSLFSDSKDDDNDDYDGWMSWVDSKNNTLDDGYDDQLCDGHSHEQSWWWLWL